MVLLEVCVESVESARRAKLGGANRLELCTALCQGGLTPTIGLLRGVKRHCSEIPVMCLIRCRPGGFNYTEEEVDIMFNDIIALRENGADGFVIGALKVSGEIDMESCTRLREACGNLPMTFHRAFDFASERIPVALQKVKEIGCTRILTTGRQQNVIEGEEVLKTLIRTSRDFGITIMPGGGVTAQNIRRVLSALNPEELHMSASPKGSEQIPGMGQPMIVDLLVVENAMDILRAFSQNT